MKSPLPEIKIAFIGNKSSGKTTLVNALLRGKYSDAANDRSKDGINSFRVVIAAETSESRSNVMVDKSNAIAASIVTTDVKVQDALFDTHTDTNLVLIDVPTINTRNAQDFYLQYINTQWESFDCVVVVLNGGKGFLDQLDFLHLIKTNLTTKKELPILFVVNKVDAILLHHCALAQNFEQLRKLVKSIFMTSIIPLSAGSAFIYRCAAGLSFENFRQLDGKLITKIGRIACDNQDASKCAFGDHDAFEFANSELFHLSNMVATNFPAFLDALSRCVGECKEQMFLESKPSASSQ